MYYIYTGIESVKGDPTVYHMHILHYKNRGEIQGSLSTLKIGCHKTAYSQKASV